MYGRMNARMASTQSARRWGSTLNNFASAVVRYLPPVFSGLALTVMSLCATAANMTVEVHDAAGQPLAYAAVMATWPGAPPPDLGIGPSIMGQRDLHFVPHMLIVPLHGQVIFPNQDKTRHHVYSFSKAKTFNIKLYVGHPKHAISFDKPGVVTLGCNIHDNMQAYIIVSPDPRWAITNANGQAVLPDLPDKPVTLSLWQPWMRSEATRFTRHVARDTDVVRITLHVNRPPAPAPPKTPSLQDRFNQLAH